MNRKHNLLFVLLAILFVFSSFTGAYRILPTVKATYVEGTIMRDTDWTLVDSPFIVSNSIMVNPGVTLTIEPGVEVRFGENFSITVNGRIVADGTDDREIRFTSDNLHPSMGDWGTILISGTQQSSITHCTTEYGTNGIILESGSLNLRNNFVRLNTNGTTVNGGSIIIEDNEITNNTMNGINVAGGSQVIIQNNVISSNGDGIVLAGTLTGSIDITQNNILLNGQSGIVLESDAYYNTAILQNNVSLNNYGFRVATNMSTYITRNYISNNIVGIFYENGNGHEAHFNDIYNNTVGMDISSTVSVDATYNYWGDKSGPFHSSLNPHGKGNKVGSDGVNLDFIFFLSAPIDYSNAAPTATLQTDKSLVAPNQNVTFIGTNSYDDGRVDQYFFDFGDGANSGWTTLSLFNHTYSSIGTYNASLKVIDDFGTISQNVATTTIAVQYLTLLKVSVSLDKQIIDYNGNVSVTVYVSDDLGSVENANVALLSLKGGTFSSMPVSTNSSGYFDAVFTAPNVTGLSNVRIIATAAKVGYADGSSHVYLEVLPPLQIDITSESMSFKSEETEAMTLHVADALGQPVSNASVGLASDNGTLSTSTGTTDVDGIMTFNFTAPYTLSPTNVTVTATAAKSGYANSVSQKTIPVLQNVLTVQVTPDTATIVSEKTTNITALVTCDAKPVPNATITVSSNNVGNFNPTTGTADSNGITTFFFTAPQTTSLLNATMTAVATKDRYISGEGQTVVAIEPKVLTVQVTTENSATVSESNVTVRVHVTYEDAPVQDSNVTITSENGGRFSQPTGVTDGHGSVTFVFTAPPASAQLNATVTAQASKMGYVDGKGSLTIAVGPGNMTVQIQVSSSAIESNNSAVVTVKVASNTTPIAGAQVTVSASVGNFSATNGSTDSNGTCTFMFHAPITRTQLSALIVANVTGNGYIANSNQTTINIIPVTFTQAEGGWSLTTILLIIIPIVITVLVVAVLIKLKVLVVSTKEEENAA